MQLSKREYKYRQKIINENHYNKKEQHILDVYVKRVGFFNTYYKYYKSGQNLSMYIPVNTEKIIKSFKKIGISLKNTTDNFRKLSDVMNDMSKNWSKI